MGLYRTGSDELGGDTSTDERRARPVLMHTQQRLGLPARTAAFDPRVAEAMLPKAHVRTDQTTSFEAPANLLASRLLKARVKVNSTRQGTPRPTGPWSPGAVQRAIELKSNESGEVAPNAPVWPRPTTETIEYEAFAALSRQTVPVEPAFIARPRLGKSRPQMSPVPDKSTRPVTPAPDLLLRPRAEDALMPRVNAMVERRSAELSLPSVILPSVDRHHVEKLVAVLLFACAIGLLYLNLS